MYWKNQNRSDPPILEARALIMDATRLAASYSRTPLAFASENSQQVPVVATVAFCFLGWRTGIGNKICPESHSRRHSSIMGTLMDNNSAETALLLERARAGDQAAVNDLFMQHRARLRRMVELRLDRRLQARIDTSDVIQEAYVEIFRRLDEYLQDPAFPLFL
ncbi:MAG: hypothetical protein MUF23_03655 [Pirellula sp.]|jgi:hypothetical protein|nr:hypothetical protein [Pirellula sp.]